MNGDPGHLPRLLLDAGVIDQETLTEALEKQKESNAPIGRVLVEEGMVAERDLVRVLAENIGIEFVDLEEMTVDPAAASIIPESLATRYGAIPIGFEDGKLVVAMADPGNVLAIDDIRALSGTEVIPKVATRSDVEGAIRRLGALDESVTDLAELAAGDVETDDLGIIEAAAEDAPVVKLVNTLITRATADRASDIHIEPTEKDLTIRFRIDGVLHEIMRTPRSIAAAVVSRLKIMSDINIAERRIPQDGRVSLKVSGRQLDLRVSTLPTIYGEKVVLRILDTSTAMLDLAELGFLQDTFDGMSKLANLPYGTVIVTGPTGSGKSTTLYATLNMINRPEVNIVTVEDPVEYRLSGINQVQVNRKAGLTFASALRSILRQDPDIMLIGEIRDQETAMIAMESALTGHLVLSTLHTNDAPSTISRLTEMDVEPFLVGSAVDGILAQRLARRLCTSCKVAYEPSIEALRETGWSFEEQGQELPTLYRPEGCKACARTGYRGRVALHELMVVSEEIERMAVERAATDEIAKMAVSQGMRRLREDGMEKVRTGITSIEEVLRVVV
ncbi:MAG: GspE/PulE family protein [Acidimicrobiia bacterium]